MTKFKFPLEYTKKFQNALASWKIWSNNDKIRMIKSEKQIQKKLKKLKKVFAVWIEEKSNINLASFTLYLKIGLLENNPRKLPLKNTALFVEYNIKKDSKAYTTLMWFDKKKNYVKLRRITGHPLKIKELYNKIHIDPTMYRFNGGVGVFRKSFPDPNIKLVDLSDAHKTLLFVDDKNHVVWLWHGESVNTRNKFIAAKMAPRIKDKHGIAYKIRPVDQGKEPIEFLNMLGIEKENDEN